MSTVSPAINTNSNTNAQATQADMQADSEARGRFPGWTFLNGQYRVNGDPYKAHIRDPAGRTWTVWFGRSDQITRVTQGNR